jgi:hypothetical protein
MHSGPLVLLRMWLFHARPWQQLLVCIAFMVAGAGLVVLTGQAAGALMIVFGALLACPALKALSAAHEFPGDDARQRDPVDRVGQ